MATLAESRSTARPKGKSVKLEKDDQAAKAKEMEAREARINYTIDMVVHDLVSQGHLHPAKSYLLKTAEMKEHIGRMCDQLNRRKKEEQRNSNKRRTIPKSLSTPNKPFTATVSRVSSSRKETPVTSVDPAPLNYMEDVKKKLFASKSANLPTSSSPNHREVKKAEPWVTPRDVTNTRPPQQLNSPRSSKENRIRKELTLMSQRSNATPANAYRAKIDMSGFDNDEISLDLDDRKLVITASRLKKGQQNARKVTEVIEIPEGVNLENLKIGRRLDGSLVIEEFVSGVD